ncbi:MAG TPA: VOC family protein [Polyangia bacterium]|jgi:catechol 2,3-dioxygenase-like lactoylglutathione lyase family enzyme|nr:VOC family protein [Polyangia bacterium]
MLDHIIITVSDMKRSAAFYEKALGALGISHFQDYKGENGHPDLIGFGDGKRGFFWIKRGKPNPTAVHFAFAARTNDAVDTFYEVALAAGAKNNISPRIRHEYYAGYYAADVLDPDGYSIEVVHKR